MVRDYAKRLLTGSAAAAAGWGRSSSLFLFFTRSLFSAQPLRPALKIAFVRFGLTGFLFALFVACAGGGGGGGSSSSNEPSFPLMDVFVNGMNVTEGTPVYLDRGTPASFSANITSCVNLCGEVRVGYFRSDDTSFSPEEEIVGMNLTLNASDSGKLIEFDFTTEEAPGSYHYGVCINGDACVRAVEIIVRGLEITDISVVLTQNANSLIITAEVFCYGQMVRCDSPLSFYLSSDEDVSTEDRELANQMVATAAGLDNSTSFTVSDLRAEIEPGNYYIGACADGGCMAGQSLVVPGLNFVDFVVKPLLVEPFVVKPGDSLNITAEARCYGEDECSTTTVRFFRMLGEEGEQELLNTTASMSVAGNTARNFTFGGEVVNYMEDFALYDVCTDLARGVCTDQVNVSLDSDGDGIANRDDPDDDNDTLNDDADTGNSTSMIPCRLLADCDGDGLNDGEDTGQNSDGTPCRQLTDCDGDGLNDNEDTGVNSANMPCRLLTDCDEDGLNDGEDTGQNSNGTPCHLLTDCDEDGLNDGEDTGQNSANMPCHELADCDGDGINDGEDTGQNSANMPCHELADCDGDGSNDNVDVDVDGDGLIELRTADELNNIRYSLDGSGYQESETATKDTAGCPTSPATGCNGYELVAPADLTAYGTGQGWQPIGETATPFTAIFDGNGFPIRDLFINRSDEDDIGSLWCH